MRKIREKLCSESGASILLALLFFLLCAMVGASVLMAAASNAGKSRSNREEQQKYLTLSSALQLVCDELTAAEYTAKYNYNSEKKDVAPVIDADGKVITPGYSYMIYTYVQTTGVYTGALSQEDKCVLPLLKELDWLFAQDFHVSGVSAPDQLFVTKLEAPSDITEPGTAHKLTLTVTEQVDKPGLNDTPVEVTVTLTKDYGFRLAASLDGYSMYADLALKKGCTRPKPIQPGSGSTPTCDPIGWELSQITREEPK